MSDNDNSRIVYSTDGGDQRGRRDETAAHEPTGPLRVSIEKRRGKVVTLVHGIAPAEIRDVAAKLKRRCSSGGTVKDGVIEIQGDHRETVTALLDL
jgi:translation initiation factor 1